MNFIIHIFKFIIEAQSGACLFLFTHMVILSIIKVYNLSYRFIQQIFYSSKIIQTRTHPSVAPLQLMQNTFAFWDLFKHMLMYASKGVNKTNVSLNYYKWKKNKLVLSRAELIPYWDQQLYQTKIKMMFELRWILLLHCAVSIWPYIVPFNFASIPN